MLSSLESERLDFTWDLGIGIWNFWNNSSDGAASSKSQARLVGGKAHQIDDRSGSHQQDRAKATSASLIPIYSGRCDASGASSILEPSLTDRPRTAFSTSAIRFSCAAPHAHFRPSYLDVLARAGRRCLWIKSAPEVFRLTSCHIHDSRASARAIVINPVE